MPRYANSGDLVDAWYEKENEGSSTFDLCIKCGDRYDEKPLHSSLNPYQRNEPRGVLYEMDSPLYEEYDFEGYRCEVCQVPLSQKNY